MKCARRSVFASRSTLKPNPTMSGKIRNPGRRCKICGGKCNKQMRYCKLCARERKAAKESHD